MAPPVVSAVNAAVGPLWIEVGIAVVCLPLEIAAGIAVVRPPHAFAVLPEISVGLDEQAVVIAPGVSNLGHPRFVAFPNDCSFARCSSSD